MQQLKNHSVNPSKEVRMVTIAVFKKMEHAVQLSKKITNKGFLAYVATRIGNKNGLNYRLLIPEEIHKEVKKLLIH